MLARVRDFISNTIYTLKTAKTAVPEVQALEQRLPNIQKIEDIGEKITAYDQLRHDCTALADKRHQPYDVIKNVASLVALGMIFGGMPLIMAAQAAASVGLHLGATALMVSGPLVFLAAIRPRMNDAPLDEISKIGRTALGEIEKLKQSQDLLHLSASPHFDNVLKNHPEIKEVFLLASARQTGTAAPPRAEAENVASRASGALDCRI